MKEVLKIINGFFNNNKELVLYSIVFQIAQSLMESIVIPYIIANSCNNITNLVKFKKDLINLVCVWILVKIIVCISLHYHSIIEPEITRYITICLLRCVFEKFDNDNHIVDISLIIDKLHLLKNNLSDISYLLFTIFIPKGIVIVISCLSFLLIDKDIGIKIILSLIIQICINIYNVRNESGISKEDINREKDKMYEYIEDLLVNLSTIQSIENGFKLEMENIKINTEKVKEKEINKLLRVNRGQYIGFIVNTILFSLLVIDIYLKYTRKEISKEITISLIMLLVGLFDIISDVTYYIAEIVYKFGILKNNDRFLKELILEKSKRELIDIKSEKLDNYNIYLKDITFFYPKTNNKIFDKFSLEIPENKVALIYGKSGLGKTTLIKLMFGILIPCGGYVIIGGKNIDKFNIRKYMCYVEQNTNNLFNRTILENIIYGVNIESDEKLRVIREHIKDIFLKFNLYDIFKILDNDNEQWHFLDQKVGKLGKKLSGGQKKIIHLIRIYFNDISKIVILDEPSTGLDVKSKESVISFIKYLNSKEKTIIIVSHDECFKKISDLVIDFNLK